MKVLFAFTLIVNLFSFEALASERFRCIRDAVEGTGIRVTEESLAQAKQAFCAVSRLADSGPLRKMKNFLARTPINQSRAKEFMAENCGGSLLLLVGGHLFDVFVLEEFLNKEGNTPILRNYTNFVEGLAFMGIFHGCSGLSSPNKQRQFLAAALGANVAGNLFFEVGPTNKRDSTDWGDLTAGGLATATYLTWALYAEKRYGLNASEICRK